jgi:hypothetical protein
VITKEAMVRLSSPIARAALAAMISVGSLFAQATGSLTGVVFDPLGEPLPGADVQVSVPSDKIFRATTSDKGAYSIAGLLAGDYQVAVFVHGGRSFVQQGLAIGAGQSVKLEIHLKDDGQLGAIGDNAIAAAALSRRPVPAGPTPKALDGHPDLSGVWAPAKKIEEGKPDMLPWAAAKVKERLENHFRDIPTSACLPWGPTFDLPTTFKFIQAPKTIVILSEDVFSYRQVHMDGRPHPPDADPTWMGHSIGRWEGDTLVVDTAGMNDKGWSPIPYPRTEKFHMIERIRRPDLGHLEIETTIDDPGTYTKPWSFKVASTLLVGDEIGEYICAENNQYAGHAR